MMTRYSISFVLSILIIIGCLAMQTGCKAFESQAVNNDVIDTLLEKSSDINATAPPCDVRPTSWDEMLEKYYDYVAENPQIYTLLNHSETEQGFTDDEMSAFSIITMSISGNLDSANGNAKQEFDEITEKYFGVKIENYDNRMTRVIPETDMVVSSGWDYPKTYMVLKELAENIDGSKTGLFYTYFETMGDELPDKGQIKSDLLHGKADWYNRPVNFVEMKFREEYDSNGSMYFKFISAKLLEETN